jgi:hypothetical protein
MAAKTVNDFLLGGGGASAKFDNIGDTVTGTITVTPELRQQTDFATKKPQFWDDGEPKMQVVVNLATDQRDPSVDDDDGQRNIYIKGQMQQATRDALKAAGAKGLEVGGTLTVAFIGTEPTNAGSPKKLYAVSYVPAAANFVNGQQAPAPASPPSQPAAPPAGPAIDPNVIAAYRNLPPEQQDALTKGQPALRAALGLQG